MRSLSLVRMPCFRRCSMISTTSPNHEGVEGTECEEVWMMTEESAILVMCTSLLGKMCILPQERHILCLLATNYISLRNSWAGTAIYVSLLVFVISVLLSLPFLQRLRI